MFRLLNALVHMPYFFLMEMLHRLHDIFYYWRNPIFRKADLALIRAYLFRNPYRMCRRYFSSKNCIENNENKVQVIYGETYAMTFHLLTVRLKMTQHDRVYELGCGRGRGCFFMHAMTDAEVIGIDLNPEFIHKAKAISSKLSLERLHFRQESIFDTNLADATILYLYGSAFNEIATFGLIEKFSQLPAGILIACVGFSLNDYYDEPLFLDVDEFEVFFLWGKTRIWVCETLGLGLATEAERELSQALTDEFLKSDIN